MLMNSVEMSLNMGSLPPSPGLPEAASAETRPEELAGSADPWRIILQLGELLVANCSAETLRQKALALLMQLPGLIGAWIGRPNGQGLLVADNATDPDLLSLLNGGAYPISVREDSPWGKGPAGRAWRSSMPYILDDWQSAPAAGPWLESSRARGWRATAALPLRGHKGHHGILVIYADRPRFFATTLPRTVISQFGAVLGLAIEEREKHESLYRMQRLYSTLFTASHALLAARTESSVLSGICDRLVESGLFIAAAIGRPDRENILRYDVASTGMCSLDHDIFQSVDAAGEELLLGVRAWRQRRIVFANRYGSDPVVARWRPLLAEARLEAVAAVPIRRRGRQWAVLMVAASQRDMFDAELIRLVEQLAALIGRALDEIDLKAKLRADRLSQSQLARRDSLTRLPNRLALMEYLPQAIARAARRGEMMAVALFDLDDFKRINDRFGHAGGDAALRGMARRIGKILRGSDFLARLGGDEFALILEDLAPGQHLGEFCARLEAALEAPLRLPGGDVVHAGISLGATLFSEGRGAVDTLLRQADIALYDAKSRKTTRQRFWTIYQEAAGVEPRHDNYGNLPVRHAIDST